MESYKSWLKLCIRHKITLEQMMLLYLLKMKEFEDPRSVSNQYITQVEVFSAERVIIPLEQAGYIINLNSSGEYYPEFLVPTDKADEIFANELMGEELWNAYPKTFPIDGSGQFLARVGIEKEEFIDEYLRKINYDPTLHKTVMKRLGVYERMVKEGKLNGYKIVDWMRQRMWEVVPDEDTPKFGHDL